MDSRPHAMISLPVISGYGEWRGRAVLVSAIRPQWKACCMVPWHILKES